MAYWAEPFESVITPVLGGVFLSSHLAASRRPKKESRWVAWTVGTIDTANSASPAASVATSPTRRRLPLRMSMSAGRPNSSAATQHRPRAPRIESTGIAGSR